jgi:putative acetyltransferase
MFTYPKPKDEDMVEEYPATVKAGGGFFYDEVLEYRVWCYPHEGAKDKFDGDDYYFAFASFEVALEFSKSEAGAQEPLVLIRQFEWINEVEPGKYIHEKGERIAEWPAQYLEGRKRQVDSIERFFRERNT